MKKLSSKTCFFGGGLLLTIQYIFWFLLGDDSYVLIHDNLDHEFVFIQQLLNSGNLFGFDLNGQIDGVMNGIPRNFYRSGFSFTFLIFSLFPPFIAYVTHHMIVHLIGYLGMFVLLKKHFIQKNNLIVLGISLCFGLLSYYHIQYGISIAGQPILLYAFLNLLKNNIKSYNWFIILFFPFFSFLPVTLPFFIPLLVIIGLNSYFNEKKFPVKYALGIVLLCGVNLLVEFNLIYSILFSDIQSHRAEWDKIFLNGGLPKFKNIIQTVFDKLKHTHYHVGTLYTIPTIIAVFLFYFQKKRSIIVNFILIFLLFEAVWYPLSDFITYGLRQEISFFNTFNLKRFYFMSPFLWLLVLSIALDKINFSSRLKNKISSLLILTTIASTVVNNIELINNIRLLTSYETATIYPTFSQFYDNQLFNKIRIDLEIDKNESEKKIICVGIFPNIAQYNGIKTLDSYQNNYPLEFKHEFRKVISNELEKNHEIKQYYDFWGSRCYAFSSEIGKRFIFHKSTNKIINNLDYDWSQFIAMNGRYVLSSVKINTTNQQQLKFFKSYSSRESFWKIYLYEILEKI